MFKKKYRIVEFGDGKFAAERLILGFIPTGEYLTCDLRLDGSFWSNTRCETMEIAELRVKHRLLDEAADKKVITIVKVHKKLP